MVGRVWSGIAKDIANEFDKYVFKQFERHGYSKFDVMVAGLEGRLTTIGDDDCRSYGVVNDEYPYEPKYLFNIKKDVEIVESNGTGYTITCNLYCEDIVKPKGE